MDCSVILEVRNKLVNIISNTPIKMKTVPVLTAILICALTFGSYAQGFDKLKLDQFLELIETNNRGMGSFSLMKDGKEVYSKAYGFAQAEKGGKPNHDTQYRIGSISKMYTAVIIMKLVEQKKLKLDQKINRFLPDIPNADKITIEHLLRHRSGLHNFTDDADYFTYLEKPQTEKEMLDRIKEKGTDFEPDQQAEYSNTNYYLLTLIAEKASAKKFNVLLNDFIIQPCGLKHTSYAGPIPGNINWAASYTRLTEWTPATRTDLSIPAGAGAILSTPTEVNIFLSNLYTGKLLKTETVNTMKKTIDTYGIGMFEIPFYDKKGYGHTGGIDGFHTIAVHFEKDNVSAAIFSNGEVMSLNDILLGALSIYFDKEFDLPVFTPEIILSEDELEPLTGVYSSPTFPMKITITREQNKLIAQATGQPGFPLEAYEKDKFRFEQAHLTIEFVQQEQTLILRQGGGMFELKKE